MTLRLQMLLLQAVIVCATTATTGVLAGALQEYAIRDAAQQRMTAVALSVANLPTIHDAFETDDPSEVIQPIAEVIREASDVTYVVVTDSEGIRFSHPDPSRIGEMVSTDPSVPLSGEIYVGTQTGTLGTSWRVKVPIFADDGRTVIGTVSVGILESEITADFLGNLVWLLLAMVLSALLGVFGAAWVTRLIRRRIHGLEPSEISSLVGNRDTVLHGVSEGVVTVDAAGRIALVNDAAERLLGTPADELLGRPAIEVLGPALAAVVEEGEAEGRLVLAGERVLIARSTRPADPDARTAAETTLLLRDHTEMHDALRRMDGAQSLTNGLRAQTHEFANAMHVVSGLLEIGQLDQARAYIARRSPGGAIGLGPDATVFGDLEITALLAVKAAQAREVGIDLSVRDAGDRELPPGVAADLLTVVGNLVDNAIEACGLGDRIVISAQRAKGSVVLTVEDTGPGVPPHLRAWVFSEGVSTKDAEGERDGPRRGIGLALIRRIVDRRRGSVVVDESELGGARFRVTLPVRSRTRSTARSAT